MSKGLVISIVSNTYEVEDIEQDAIVKCVPRGKLKNNDTTIVVGDNVEFEYQTEDTGVINEILERSNYIKRPKMSNLTQMIFVLSMKMPKPDLLLLDKQLAFAEYNNIKSVIVLNKIDLEKDDKINEIEKLYKKIGYKVIKTNAKTGEGIEDICKVLDNEITAFSGNSGVGKTHLVASISNELIEKDKLVLMGRLTSLLDMIKETFKDNSRLENELIELFSNIDMFVIDDLGTEKISSWALDKLYTIIVNRNENKLPIIITTKFDKESLLHRFYQSNDKELSKAIIQKLYQMCYGIKLKRYDENQKEKASTSDQTKC